jgi:D-serine deaminase-like pyridoxal phosphate-dependent protein
MKLKRPTLLIDKEKCLQNIRKMKEKADRQGVKFRPHFKTHQSAEVGEWFRNAGVEAITVSSVTMARYFANHGWKDITIAFPVNFAEADEINELAKTMRLNLLIESMEAFVFVEDNIRSKTGIFIKIDAGYHRTGIPVDDHENILILILEILHARHHEFEGFILHNGNTYHAGNADEIQRIHHESMSKVNSLKAFLDQHDIHPKISFGDTPSMSIISDFSGIDEIRPGNFVFYDVMQQNLGACGFADIAVVLACPVVAKNTDRNELVIYGGAIHLSKDFITDGEGNQIYGRVVFFDKTGWQEPMENTFIKSLSQEHGIIKTTPEQVKNIKIGSFIGILPVHSCLTVHQMREFYTLKGERITTYLSC